MEGGASVDGGTSVDGDVSLFGSDSGDDDVESDSEHGACIT